jgi:hypothetical protein
MRPPSKHPATIPPEELLAQCDVQRVRRSGPGGQRRNKVETGIVLTHRSSGLSVEASERRSQIENQRVALFRLRLKLAVQTRLPVQPDSAPSELWQSRRVGRRISVNSEHDDFPALLAEAMDVVTAYDMDLHAAADVLGTTQSQLTRLLKAEPQALTLVNRIRSELGLYRLR